MLAGIVRHFGEVKAEEAPMPTIGEYDALVKIIACAFCNGTDRHIIEGTLPFVSALPLILGHESVGRVVEIGTKVRNYKVGNIVFRPSAVYKGTSGVPNSCWGGFAEYGIISDSKALAEDKTGHPISDLKTAQQIIPDGIDPVEATTLITVKETLSSLLIADFKANQNLLIFGSGPVGMSFALCGRMLGASKIVIVGRRAERLKQTLAFGVDDVINSSTEDVIQKSRELSKGRGFDLVVDAVGDYDLINLAVKCVTHRGIVGQYGVPIVPREHFQQFHLDFRGTPGNWSLSFLNPDEPSTHEIVCGWVKHGLISMKTFISEVMPLKEIDRAYEMVKDGNVIKVILTM